MEIVAGQEVPFALPHLHSQFVYIVPHEIDLPHKLLHQLCMFVFKSEAKDVSGEFHMPIPVVSPHRHTWILTWKITKMLLRCLHGPFILGLKAEVFKPSRNKSA